MQTAYISNFHIDFINSCRILNWPSFYIIDVYYANYKEPWTVMYFEFLLQT